MIYHLPRWKSTMWVVLGPGHKQMNSSMGGCHYLMVFRNYATMPLCPRILAAAVFVNCKQDTSVFKWRSVTSAKSSKADCHFPAALQEAMAASADWLDAFHCLKQSQDHLYETWSCGMLRQHVATMAALSWLPTDFETNTEYSESRVKQIWMFTKWRWKINCQLGVDSLRCWSTKALLGSTWRPFHRQWLWHCMGWHPIEGWKLWLSAAKPMLGATGCSPCMCWWPLCK